MKATNKDDTSTSAEEKALVILVLVFIIIIIVALIILTCLENRWYASINEGERLNNEAVNSDTYTLITMEDKEMLTSSWKQITTDENLRKNARQFFSQLFQKNPYMKKYFRFFKGSAADKIKWPPQFRAHTLAFMGLMTSYMNHIHDKDLVSEIIERSVTTHLERRITLFDYERLGAMFPDYVGFILGNNDDRDRKRAWERFWKWHNAIVADVMDREKRKSGSNRSDQSSDIDLDD